MAGPLFSLINRIPYTPMPESTSFLEVQAELHMRLDLTHRRHGTRAKLISHEPEDTNT